MSGIELMIERRRKSIFSLKNFIVIQTLLLMVSIIATYWMANFYYSSVGHELTKRELSNSLYDFQKIFQTTALSPEKMCDLLAKRRISIISNDGAVLCDSSVADVVDLDDHSKRPEILGAKQHGIGFSERFSISVGTSMMYGAILVPKLEQLYYLRLAIPVAKLDFAIQKVTKTIFWYLIPIMLIFLIASVWLLSLKDKYDRGKTRKLKEDLLANIGHEVRTPLAALKGRVQILLGSNDEERLVDQKRHLEKIELSVDRITSLFSDVLDLTGLERGGQFFVESIELEPLFCEMVETLLERYRAKNINIRRNVTVPVIEADSKMLHQILNNLIDNAFKYSLAGGEITIVVKESGSEVLFQIGDNGVGISNDNHKKIFERFYRVDVSRSRSLGGTGLGLAIAKHAVLRHHGKIWVESSEGEGSLFSVLLPHKQIDH